MSDNSANNKRIAKNTIFLYIRMLISTLVSLYTSRVVLQTLGVEDYGIYGVVGGVVSMFSFLNASMSGATSRFLTYELGKGNFQKLKDTFSSALIIHIGIALTILILSETIGIWFLYNKLVIPDGRMDAAFWVLQFSIISMAVSVTQVPYNATIIAHEKMDIYAYIELLNVGLKLLIVYLLVFGNFDKLILYVGLVLIVSITIAMIYRVYCIKHFSESIFHYVFDKSIIKPMLSFSGWDLYGNMCVAVRQQGNNFLINMFFGVTLNAASSIATTVYGAISGLSQNVVQAFRPQIIKSFAQDNYKQMQILMNSSVKYMILLYGCFLFPFIFEMSFIMKLWLIEVPKYSPDFCRITLVYGLCGMISGVLVIGIHATGKIKLLSTVTGSIYLISIPISYIILLKGNNPFSTYYVTLGTNIVALLSNFVIFKSKISQFSILSFAKNIFNAICILIICAIPVIFIWNVMDESIFRLLSLLATNVFFILIITYSFVIDSQTRINISTKIKHYLHIDN